MDNPRPEKVAVVDEVKSKFEAASGVVLTEYRGLNVTEMAELRKSVREAGAEYKVYKNTLVRFAAQSLDLELDELLTGPTAIAFATPTDTMPGDTVTLAKALVDFAKSNENLVLKGGLLGDVPLDPAGIKALAKTPPRAQLYAEFLGAGLSFYQEFAGLLDSKLREFGYALQELADKGVLAEGEPVAAEVETAEAADTPEESTEEATQETEAAAEVADTSAEGSDNTEEE